MVAMHAVVELDDQHYTCTSFNVFGKHKSIRRFSNFDDAVTCAKNLPSPTVKPIVSISCDIPERMTAETYAFLQEVNA